MLIQVAIGGGVEQVDVDENAILRFPMGLIGFEDATRFVLFELQYPLYLLQSIDDTHLGFVVIDPFLVDPTYRAGANQDCEVLAIEEGDSRSMFCIVSVSPAGVPVSLNLRAPVLLNSTKRIGMQYILPEERPVRHPLQVSPTGELVLPSIVAEMATC